MKISKTGVELIHHERQRQVYELGYKAEGDDKHTAGELLHAAHAAVHALGEGPPLESVCRFDGGEDDVTLLAKAGALVAAEIDRRLRARKKAEPRRNELEPRPRSE
jgi:hypothetical protein